MAITRRVVLAAPLALASGLARADTKLGLGFTTGDSISAFAAKDQGFFAKQGLDAGLTYIAMNSNVPAALVSGSLQIGSVTTTVFLQAVDNGIDLVALNGATSVGPVNANNYAVVVRTGVPYEKPADLIGKKVAVPGFGAIMNVLFVEWLHSQGVDPTKVPLVEATFIAMPDLLKAGTVDAVLSIDPFTSRMVGSGVGRFAASFVSNLPQDIQGLIYVAQRDWTQANAQAAHAVQSAITQGADYANTHPDQARQMIAAYTKIPMPILEKMHLPVSTPALGPDSFRWMIGVMQRQGLLHTQIDQSKLVLT
jgi:NitT/TauT family transport system substrate-binding protein